MSWRGVTLQTRAASAAERRRRASTSPSFAISTWVSASCVWASATGLCSPVSNSDGECCWRTNHVSMRWTDIETWLLAGTSNGRALRLPIRHLDRRVIPGELRAVEFRPEPAHLYPHRSLHLRGLHRREDGRVPALGRVSCRFNETDDDGSSDALRTTSGHSWCVQWSVARELRRRSSRRSAVRSAEPPPARGSDWS